MNKINKIIEDFKTNYQTKKEQKVIGKEREAYHKSVLKKEKARSGEERIAPENCFISLKNINKIYDNHVQAVYNFNLDIKEHEFIVFVGPSGCGKSTTLRMIAGLESITSGDLYINGLYSNELEPKDRDIGMVFQSYALYPHMTVYENMAFGLKVNHVKKDEIHRRVMQAAEILQITDYLNRKPNALSGGQCQRVALGRAIVRNSKVFLMDEPLSNLDAKLRSTMRSEIVKLHKALNATTIYVTHDQTEAMTMASRIVVMNKGYIQQIGTPTEIYNNPANVFVATFVGSPAMNIINSKYKNGEVVFNNNLALKTPANFDETLKAFYDNEIKLSSEEINKWKTIFFDRFASSRSYKKLVKNVKTLEEYEKDAAKDSDLKAILDRTNDVLEISNTLAKNFVFVSYLELQNLHKDSETAKECEEIFNKINALNLKEDVFDELSSLYDELVTIHEFEINRIQNPEIKELVERHEQLVAIANSADKELLLGIRPEDIHLSDDVNAYEFKVNVSELLGNEYHIHLDLGDEELIAKINAKTPVESDQVLKFIFDNEKVHFFDSVTKKKIL